MISLQMKTLWLNLKHYDKYKISLFCDSLVKMSTRKTKSGIFDMATFGLGFHVKTSWAYGLDKAGRIEISRVKKLRTRADIIRSTR